MTTSGALGSESSAVNQRPAIGRTPSVGISSGVTNPATGLVGGDVPRLTAPVEYPPIDSNARLLLRYSTNSGSDIQNWLKPNARKLRRDVLEPLRLRIRQRAAG